MANKILLISTNADEAGAPRHVEALVGNLNCNGKWKFMCLFGEVGPVSIRLEEAGVPVVYVKSMRSSFNPFLFIFSLVKCIKILSNWNPKIIHCHSASAGIIGRILGLFFLLPCVYTVHGWGWRGMSRPKAIFVKTVERLFYLISSCFYIYVAHDVKKMAENQLGFSSDAGAVIYNGVPDLNQSLSKKAPNDQINILMAARVCDAKDHTTLLKAFELLPDDYSLTLCGTGTDEVDFKQYAESLCPKSYSRIFFVGQVSNISDYYTVADIYVLASHYEALPISIIEAMSFNLPIIASNVGGVSEIITAGINGFLFNKSDYQDLYGYLVVLSLPSVRNRMGASARKAYLENFNLTSMSNKVEALYSSLLH